MSPTPYTGPIAALLPHRGTMLLVDRLLDEGPERVRVEAVVRRELPFMTERGLPGWVGAEFMAQAVATYAGLQEWRAGKPIRLGFLVGTRRYDCALPFFPVGARLEISAQLELFAGNGLAVFVCAISHEGREVARAQLNAFQPHDVERYLEESPS